MNGTSYSSIPSDPNVKPQESVRQSPLVCTTQCFFIGQDQKKRGMELPIAIIHKSTKKKVTVKKKL